MYRENWTPASFSYFDWRNLHFVPKREPTSLSFLSNWNRYNWGWPFSVSFSVCDPLYNHIFLFRNCRPLDWCLFLVIIYLTCAALPKKPTTPPPPHTLSPENELLSIYICITLVIFFEIKKWDFSFYKEEKIVRFCLFLVWCNIKRFDVSHTFFNDHFTCDYELFEGKRLQWPVFVPCLLYGLTTTAATRKRNFLTRKKLGRSWRGCSPSGSI